MGEGMPKEAEGIPPIVAGDHRLAIIKADPTASWVPHADAVPAVARWDGNGGFRPSSVQNTMTIAVRMLFEL